MRRPAPDLESRAEARAQIDAIDAVSIALPGERAAEVDRVVALKAEAGVAAAAPTRAGAVIGSVRDRAAGVGFDMDTAEAMWRGMIEGFPPRDERALGIDRQERVPGTDGVDG